MNSAFAKLNEMLDEFRGSRPPLREHIGSDRRSPSAGPSDIARPNPIAKVSDTAPQGPDAAPQSPDAAPGPSTATHVPPALGPSRHDAPSYDGFVSPRGGVDQGEHVRSWSRHVSPSRTHTHQERLRDDLERTHAEISQLKDYNDYCRAHGRAPPDHYYRDLDILHSRYDQLSLALGESLLVTVGVLQSSLLQGSLLQLMLLILIVQIRHLSTDLACHPGLVLPLKIVVVQGTPPAIFLITVAIPRSAITTDSLLAPNLGTVGDPVQGGPLLQSDWDSPQGAPLLHSEWDSLQGSPLLQSEWDSPQGGPPLQSEWDSLLAPSLVTVGGPFQGSPLLQSD